MPASRDDLSRDVSLWQNLPVHDSSELADSGESPSAAPTGDITGLLESWVAGSQEALDHLLPLVMEELRRLARHHMAQSGDTVVMQPTALVNEAYLKLVGAEVQGFESRRRFFAFASHVMRDLVRDRARRRSSEKRGGGAPKAGLDEAFEVGAAVDLETAMAIDQAVEHLAESHPRQARVVELRLWGGLTIDEIALLLERSRQTVERDWALGRRRLARDLKAES